MNNSRIKHLEHYISEDPKDPFPKYALALEFLNTDKERSLELFEVLLEEHADYIPTYFHAAALYSELAMKEKAERTYELGIEKAEQLNEQHALRELKSAYLNFQFED